MVNSLEDHRREETQSRVRKRKRETVSLSIDKGTSIRKESVECTPEMLALRRLRQPAWLQSVFEAGYIVRPCLKSTKKKQHEEENRAPKNKIKTIQGITNCLK